MLNTKKPIVEINLTPLVDVSLVLVVIFMATAPMFIQSGIIVTSGEKTASAKSSQATSEDQNIVIRLEEKKIWLNEKEVSIEKLTGYLRPMLRQSNNKRVIVNPDREVKHGTVVHVMDLAKQAGGDKIIILGKTREIKKEK